ncbi:MAG: nuclear transport factor 2 family protein [Bacteroidota bacterium]
MQKLLILAAALCWLPAAHAQTDRELVYAAIEDYVDALYLVQPERIQRSVHPQLTKKGFWRPQDKPDYQPESIMTYTQLYELAGKWNIKKTLPADAPRQIEIFDVQDQTACGKLTAQWGTDYFQLAQYDGRWLITNIVWQSPPPTKNN